MPDMQLVHSHKTSSYTFILTEDEWYSGTEQQKEAWVNQIMREGQEAKCRNINILVKPDAVMSISPSPNTHSVFCHVVTNKSATEFEQELKFLVAKYRSLLSHGELITIVDGIIK